MLIMMLFEYIGCLLLDLPERIALLDRTLGKRKSSRAASARAFARSPIPSVCYKVIDNVLNMQFIYSEMSLLTFKSE